MPLFILLVLLILPLAGVQAFASQDHDQRASAGECVLLLHGLWRTEFSMKALEWKLSDAGYVVANVTYNSLLYSIEQLASRALPRGLQECREKGASPVNIVTHSLGGIVVRQYLKTQKIPNLKRVVMLGPPNQGSEVADWVESIEPLALFTPQAVAELSTGADSVPLKLGPVDFELGVIAGTVNRRVLLPGVPDEPSDGMVTVAETRVEGMKDFLEMPTTHSFIMWNSEVIYQVQHFLQHGAFDHSALERSADDHSAAKSTARVR